MKARLTNIFGLKLLPVSGEMTSTAKDMLDQETEYIDYLRRRKKFFFMTQVQQTRVHVRKKVKVKAQDEKKERSGGLFRRRRKRKTKVRVKKKKSLKEIARQRARIAGRKTNRGARAAGNKIAAFTRKKTANIGKNFATTGKTMKGQALKKVSQGTKFMTQGANKITKTAGALTKLKPQQVARTLSAVPTKTKTTIVKKLAATATKKTIAKKVATKTAAKLATKTAVKIGLKKIPVVGLIAGLGFGVQRLMKGDISGALMEVGSGLASTIPGPGTAISAGLDAALIAKDVTGMKDGGEVSSPTQALIAEGGEPELVVPHSKLGPVFQSLLKQVGTILTDVTTGFLNTLPVPTAASQSILAESAKLASVFGTKSSPLSIFKGGKVKEAAGGFLKKLGSGAMNLAKTAFKMTPMGLAAGAIGSVLGGRPAKAEDTFRKRNVINKMSEVNGVMTSSSWDSDTATSYGNFPVTDTYGSTEGRSKPHGGVDLGTPVGTPVGFKEPGEILAAGKFGGYGNMMDVWLPSAKVQMRIAHLSKIVKRTGEFIAGEKLAETGGAVGDPGAGSSTGPHLHFEADNKKNSTRYGGAGNPMPYAPLLSFSAVEPPSGEGAKGGPSLGASYGHPLQYTVKWPTSNGAMGGPGLFGAIGSAISGVAERIIEPRLVPFPVPTPIPVPVEKVITMVKPEVKSHGIDSFSGRYVAL
tara:strand:- start:3459 stop:5552 length:2094 start_codon:yes stop_codon:yes gene_type:complete